MELDGFFFNFIGIRFTYFALNNSWIVQVIYSYNLDAMDFLLDIELIKL